MVAFRRVMFLGYCAVSTIYVGIIGYQRFTNKITSEDFGPDVAITVISWALVFSAIYWIVELIMRIKEAPARPSVARAVPMYFCNTCKNMTSAPGHKGSVLIELILWCCAFVPGLIYSIWRRSGPLNVCPTCGVAALVPAGPPGAAPSERDERECPHCAERILAKAKVCKHCGSAV